MADIVHFYNKYCQSTGNTYNFSLPEWVDAQNRLNQQQNSAIINEVARQLKEG